MRWGGWGELGMCLYNVTCSVLLPCSVIQVGSMLSSQRLNKVMAEVSPVIYKSGDAKHGFNAREGGHFK